MYLCQISLQIMQINCRFLFNQRMTSQKSALRLFPLKKWQHLLIKNNGILFLIIERYL